MGQRLYIVDYDIPEEPARNRVQFYRDLRKLSKAFQKWDYSTSSVLRTQEEGLAKAVYLLVIAHSGNAHMYVAEEIIPQF